MHRACEILQRRASFPSHFDQNGRISRGRGPGLDESTFVGCQPLRYLEPFVQIIPRPACSSLDEIEKNPIQNRRIAQLPMNIYFIIAVTRIGQEHRFLGLDWSYLMILGFIGNFTFSMRFLLQWLASERQVESVNPISFLVWCIAGSVVVCVLLRFLR